MKDLNKIAASMVVAGMVLIGALGGTAYVAQAKNVKAVTQAKISLNKAMEIALQQVPGNVVSVEFENEDGQTLWEVEVLTANNEIYELEIDAASGKVLEQKKEEDDDDDDDDEKDDRD